MGPAGPAATLLDTMETTFPSSRRSLPPVPPPGRGPGGDAPDAAPVVEPDRGQPALVDPHLVDPALVDPAQEFVARLRGAAAQFAAAAGAQGAVVREAVPPARHRRSRCRVVLRYADGRETDLTFLGPVGRPGRATHAGFDAAIQRWLGTGQQRETAWLVPDEDTPDGVAVDVSAWAAAG
jgi:hypothetical protein